MSLTDKLKLYNSGLYWTWKRLQHAILNIQQAYHGERLTPWRGSIPRPKKATDR